MDEKQEKLIELGNIIKHKRIILGKSAYQIEKDHKIDRALWSKLEQGKLPSIPKPEFLMKVSNILDINYIVLYLIVGYVTKEKILEFLYEGNRIKERGRERHNEKP